MSVSTEGLFGTLSAAELPGMADWLAYITARCPWVFAEWTTSCP